MEATKKEMILSEILKTALLLGMLYATVLFGVILYLGIKF